MHSYLFFQIALLMHLSGLVLIVGTDVVEFVAYRSIFKTYKMDKSAAVNQIAMMSKLPVLLIIGAVLLILSGIGFVIITHNAFGHQLWFKIKLILIVALAANGFLMGRKSEEKLKQNLAVDAPETGEAIRNMIRFCFIQLCMLFVVILLAVFKFN